MKRSIIIGALFLAAVLLTAGYVSQAGRQGDTERNADSGSAAAAYMDVTPQEARTLIDGKPGIVVIDVSPAYAQGHLPGAVNYYVGDGSLDAAIPMLDMRNEYLVYCHSDSASMLGAQKLADAGFDKVYRLQGNYAAWVGAGYPVEM